MDIYDVLTDDHRRTATLLKDLSGTHATAKKTRERLFDQVKHALEAHSRAEERTLYARLKESRETRDQTLESIEEHRIVTNLLNEMAAMDMASAEWDAKLKVLAQNVEHHIDEEENELFEKAREVLSEDDAAELGAQVEELKRSFH